MRYPGHAPIDTDDVTPEDFADSNRYTDGGGMVHTTWRDTGGWSVRWIVRCECGWTTPGYGRPRKIDAENGWRTHVRAVIRGDRAAAS